MTGNEESQWEKSQKTRTGMSHAYRHTSPIQSWCPSVTYFIHVFMVVLVGPREGGPVCNGSVGDTRERQR
jgi:hypothetical protein